MRMAKLHLLKVILTDTFGLTIKRLSRIVRPDTSLSWSYNSWSPQFTWISTAARWTSATRSWSCPSWKRAATPGPRISRRLTSGWSWLAPFGKELKIKVCCYFIPFRCLASSFLHKMDLLVFLWCLHGRRIMRWSLLSCLWKTKKLGNPYQALSKELWLNCHFEQVIEYFPRSVTDLA